MAGVAPASTAFRVPTGHNVEDLVKEQFPFPADMELYASKHGVFRFGSGTKGDGPYLSNFCELPNPVKLVSVASRLGFDEGGKVSFTLKPKTTDFNTSEAAYQALFKTEEPDTSRLACGGDLSTLDAFFTIDSSSAEKKIKHWGPKKSGRPGMSGIIPKLAVGAFSKKLGINVLKRQISKGDSGKHNFKLMCTQFMHILRSKYNTNPEFKAKLLATGDKLLMEFSRSAGRETDTGKPPLWTALDKDGTIKGINLMGRMHMKLRAEFRAGLG